MRCLLCIPFGIVLVLAAETARAQPRYGALLRDGSWIVGTELVGDSWEPTAKIDNQRLFEPANPARAVCEELRQCLPPEDFLALANGDVLPGRVREFLPADSQSGQPDRLLVELHSPLHPAKEDFLAVRADRVLQIVRGGEPSTEPPPGTIRFADGRTLIARSVRFSKEGIRGLTDDEVVEAGFDEILQLHLPQVDVLAAVVADTRSPPLDRTAGIVRLHTVRGAVLTYRRSAGRVEMRFPPTEEQPRRRASQAVRSLLIEPSWAVGTVVVPIDSIFRLGFRSDSEVPLSALPARALREKRGIHYWPWRRDRSVTGGDLRSGLITAVWGVGTHSHSEIAFQLPPGARRFHAVVGLDAAVGGGGCVRVGAFRDRVEGKPLFTSPLLTGADDPVTVGPLDISGANTLILVTAMAHAERPPGADPFDICDQVNWLMPTVTLESPADDPPTP